MTDTHKMLSPRKILLKDINTCLTCSLCGGYFIDATTVVDCSHTFCRACIVRHFESSRLCPSCGTLVHKNKPVTKLRSDTTLQSLVYKVVPALYSKELQRRADFYHSTGFRANSSCSDDSILGDRNQDNEEWVISNIGDSSLYYSPDDTISLSVEYYTKEIENELKSELETKTTNNESENLNQITNNNNNESEENTSENKSETNTLNNLKESDSNESSEKTVDSEKVSDNSELKSVNSDIEVPEIVDNLFGLTHKRFLQCPAAVRMSHLMKFLRMKFALSNENRVDIIYSGEVLPSYFSLIDVAYTFKWNRDKPMRFFYLIYIPTIRPVVPQQPTVEPSPPKPLPMIPPLKIEIPNNKLEFKIDNSPADTKIKKLKEIKIKEPIKPEEDKKEDNNNKISPKIKPEKSMPEIKPIQKSVKFVDYPKLSNVEYKVKNNDSIQSNTTENCVYEYIEPDKDEIKAFAERRDREWAMQKYPEVHVSKKRKKNKHSKNEFMHKKRKLHAEITSNEVLSNNDDSLKLKVKLSVANGHKHKHRSSSNSSSSNNILSIEPVKTQELSPKERLLQMRQVRHKQLIPPNNDEKNKTENNLKMIITSEKTTEKPEAIPEKLEINAKLPENNKTPELIATGKTLRSDFSNKTSLSKDICNKFVRVSLEKFGDKNSPPKTKPVNNLQIKNIENKEEKCVDSKTEIIPIDNKLENNKIVSINKVTDSLSVKAADNKNGSKIVDKINTNKIVDNKMTEIPQKPNDLKQNSVEIKDKVNKVEQKVSFKPMENKINPKLLESKQKLVESVKNTPKVETKQLQKPDNKQIDESKAIENKLNNIKTSQSTLVTKNFTVSKVETGKRKLESPDMQSDKRPSLEITVINLVSRANTSAVQTNPIQSKPITSTQTKTSMSTSHDGPPVKKIRPPPLTIPLGRIQKMNNINKNVQKPPEKCDIFGALDLSAKPVNKTDIKSNDFKMHSASPKAKIQDQIQSIIRPKTPIKTGQDVKNDPNKNLSEKRPNISNLQMLSESAVQIRELMVKSTPISAIPNLIKKIPNPITQNSANKNEFLQKNPNFQKNPNLISKSPQNVPKINNFAQKPPNFISKNLQKLPKLNEISKGQFCRLNSGQIRPQRPAGQNQTIRNIPNPSLLVRQQNQNRINSLIQNPENPEKKPENEPEKRSENNKTSEPPPLKPIESFKK